jgi:hypothetical protein
MKFYGLDSNVAAVESILCKRAIHSVFLGSLSGTAEFHVQALCINTLDYRKMAPCSCG